MVMMMNDDDDDEYLFAIQNTLGYEQ